MSDTQTRTVIVALSEDEKADWLRITQILGWHRLLACVPVTAFPVRSRGLLAWVCSWLSFALLEAIPSYGRVTHAAGGRISRLDLIGLATQARDQAYARYRTWYEFIARTTPPADTWEYMLAANQQQDPKTRVAHQDLRTAFEAQPRVMAMLAYNSYPAVPYQWDLDDLAALQAGEAVYVALHWQEALTGDAVVTPEGRLIEPASRSLADRLRYLADATRVIHGLSPRQYLVAVTAAPAPCS